MGPSADEIEREIRETRDRIDENLEELEERAATSAKHYWRIAAVVIGVAVGGLGGFLLYRRLTRGRLKDRLEEMPPDRLRNLVEDLASRLKKRAPSVTVTINEKKDAEPGVIKSIIRKAAPALVGTASTAVMDRVIRSRDDHDSPRVVPAYE